MRILMMTNTFFPHVGGVARSVQAFMREYQSFGHDVLVVAPEFEGMPEKEEQVIRVPAIQNFNGSDFSVSLPIPKHLTPPLDRFQPEIVHSHHPFLLGDTALRIAPLRNIPLVFTHHTLYEQYTHYVPGDSLALKRFVVDLCTGYANLCDRVIAPSESIEKILKERGVKTPLSVIPTGVDLRRFSEGDGMNFREKRGIPAKGFVVGHLGRLAPEKNLMFLARSVAAFLKKEPQAHFLLVGEGPLEKEIQGLFEKEGVGDRFYHAGLLEGNELVDAYHAMDLFAFASKSETQGMVLTEAMAAGVPVVALDASGVREVVESDRNGRLLSSETSDGFSDALAGFASLSQTERERFRKGARETAERFSMRRCASKALDLYQELSEAGRDPGKEQGQGLAATLRRLEREWQLWVNRAHAAGAVFTGFEDSGKESQ